MKRTKKVYKSITNIEIIKPQIRLYNNVKKMRGKQIKIIQVSFTQFNKV